ncbi:transmembrane protein 106A [Chanos chanos]|uniref:Transmembrane protein 106A n=1 Tax=Chanos chanos TaxID=29144 RepID=A0A6J2VD13_CHACN|nr:transmembrane protein 106A [Chanos chanos]
MVTLGQGSSSKEDERAHIIKDRSKSRMSRWLDYGSINADGPWDSCPTCQGIGRIPRGQENQLVAVIPCSDQRLKPARTKLYVCISVVLCLLFSSLVLFFLFPRSIVMSPIAFQSALVYFTPDTVEMTIKNNVNISNQNFVAVTIHDLELQVLIYETVVGKTKLANVTTIPPLTQRTVSVNTEIVIDDRGLNNYCKSSAIRIHTLFFHLQMTVKVDYLSHSEQLSTDTYEYIECGSNTTIPHSMGPN